jgi:hypothetical protein
MTFGAMIRVYGRLATIPSRLHGERLTPKKRELNAKAEELPMEVSTRFLVAYGRVEIRSKLVEPLSMRTNMTYDTGSRPQD